MRMASRMAVSSSTTKTRNGIARTSLHESGQCYPASTLRKAHTDRRVRVHGQLAGVGLAGAPARPAAKTAIATRLRGQRLLRTGKVLPRADLRTIERVRMNTAVLVGDDGQREAGRKLHLH